MFHHPHLLALLEAIVVSCVMIDHLEFILVYQHVRHAKRSFAAPVSRQRRSLCPVHRLAVKSM